MAFDPLDVRRRFPALRSDGEQLLHYLDNAATTQVLDDVLEAQRIQDETRRGGVGRGVYRLAEAATEAYEGARRTAARFLQATGPDEIVFTSGTTAAINHVAQAVGAGLGPGDEIVLSLAEHHANIVPWHMLRLQKGVSLRFLPVTDDGRIDAGSLDEVITDRCRVVGITHASNVTGAVTELQPIVGAARSVGALVVIDGAQMAAGGSVDVRALDADFYAFSGHKVFGPSGIGVLWGRRDVLESLPPFFGGGGMISEVTTERVVYADPPARFEAGTPPVTQAVGLAAALEWLRSIDAEAGARHVRSLTTQTIAGLCEHGARITGPLDDDGRIGIVSFEMPGMHPHDVCQILDRHRVAARGGHHCAQPLLHRFGLEATTRVSFSLYNTAEDVERLFEGLEAAGSTLRP